MEGTALELVSGLIEQAPIVSRWIASLAILLGAVAFLVLALPRSAFLWRKARELAVILDRHEAEADPVAGLAPDLDKVWRAMLAWSAPRRLRLAITQLNGARLRPAGSPEETWRSVYEQLANLEARWESLVRSLASAAVLVGLLGTMVGFADMSRDVGTFDAVVAAALKGKLGGVFLATIAGILSALAVLLLGAPVLRWSADRWLDTVDTAGRFVIIPALPRVPVRIEEVVAQELRRRLESVASAWVASIRSPTEAFLKAGESAARSAEQATVDLSRRLEEVASAWESSLKGPAASFVEAAEQVQGSVEAAATALRGASESLASLTELGSAAKEFADAGRSFDKGARDFAGVANQLDKAQSALLAELHDVACALNTQGDRLAALEQAMNTGAAAVVSAGESLERAVVSMSGDFREHKESVDARHDRESRFLENAVTAFSLWDERMRALKVVEDAIAVEATDMKFAVAEMASAIDRSLKPLATRMQEAIHDTWAKALDRYGVQLSLAAEGVRRQSQDAARVLQAQEEAAEKIATQVRAAAVEFGATVEHLKAPVDRLQEFLDQGFRTQGEAVSAFTHRIEHATSSVALVPSRLEESVDRVGRELSDALRTYFESTSDIWRQMRSAAEALNALPTRVDGLVSRLDAIGSQRRVDTETLHPPSQRVAAAMIDDRIMIHLGEAVDRLSAKISEAISLGFDVANALRKPIGLNTNVDGPHGTRDAVVGAPELRSRPESTLAARDTRLSGGDGATGSEYGVASMRNPDRSAVTAGAKGLGGDSGAVERTASRTVGPAAEPELMNSVTEDVLGTGSRPRSKRNWLRSLFKRWFVGG